MNDIGLPEKLTNDDRYYQGNNIQFNYTFEQNDVLCFWKDLSCVELAFARYNREGIGVRPVCAKPEGVKQ